MNVSEDKLNAAGTDTRIPLVTARAKVNAIRKWLLPWSPIAALFVVGAVLEILGNQRLLPGGDVGVIYWLLIFGAGSVARVGIIFAVAFAASMASPSRAILISRLGVALAVAYLIWAKVTECVLC